MNAATVVKKLAAMCRERTQREVAADLGMSEQYLSDVLRGYRKPGPLVLKALGLKRERVYLADER